MAAVLTARKDSRAALSKAGKAVLKNCDSPQRTIRKPIAFRTIIALQPRNPLFDERAPRK